MKTQDASILLVYRWINPRVQKMSQSNSWKATLHILAKTWRYPCCFKKNKDRCIFWTLNWYHAYGMETCFVHFSFLYLLFFEYLASIDFHSRILYLCKTQEWIKNVTRASSYIRVSSKGVKFRFRMNFPFKLRQQHSYI